MDKVWNIKKEGDINIIKHLSVALNVNMVIANLLAQRGVTSYAKPRLFSDQNFRICTIHF